jgi:hypothetical protein
LQAPEFERHLAYGARQIVAFSDSLHATVAAGGVMKAPNLRFLGFAAISVAACIASMPAKASLVADGVTYSLTETSLTSTTDQFTLDITGINGASDTEKGRYGVQSFALNKPKDFVSALAPTGFTYKAGGLNSSGCNGTGNFFCFFANTTPSGPALAPNSSLDYIFTVTTSAAGSFSGYDPGFKIHWVGSKTGKYDLVSKEITPTVVPLPAAAWLLVSGLVGVGAMARRRKSEAAG